jgi:2-polyprenyl-3-methyl-5-hydroxy-6-metoxy-1,4-benzoquinol methylase
MIRLLIWSGGRSSWSNCVTQSQRISSHTALDAGCGEGFVTHDLAVSSDMDIDAFDISDNAVRYAQAQNAAPNIHYYAQDLKDFAASKHYDLIICEEALYYLEDQERDTVVATFAESLNANGFLKLSVVTIGQNGHRRYFTEQSIRELLLKNGFKIESIRPSVIAQLKFMHRALFFVLSRLHRLVGGQSLITIGKHIVSGYEHAACYQLSILARKQ